MGFHIGLCMLLVKDICRYVHMWGAAEASSERVKSGCITQWMHIVWHRHSHVMDWCLRPMGIAKSSPYGSSSELAKSSSDPVWTLTVCAKTSCCSFLLQMSTAWWCSPTETSYCTVRNKSARFLGVAIIGVLHQSKHSPPLFHSVCVFLPLPTVVRFPAPRGSGYGTDVY